jgi:hypothetical protein
LWDAAISTTLTSPNLGGLLAIKPGVDDIALSRDGKQFFYATIAHDTLYAIPVDAINTRKIPLAHDEREVCAGWGKKMMPRIITGPPLVHAQGSWTPVPKKSICPFCGVTHRKFPPSLGDEIGVFIFIAVAIFFLLSWRR